MLSRYSLLLFSKYSSQCKRLFSIIENQTTLDNNTLQLLCIDNEQIKKRIQSNSKIDVKMVPCILCFYPDGVVEKYENEHAFTWVSQFSKPMQQVQQQQIQQQPVEQEEVEEPIPTPPPKKYQKKKIEDNATSISDLPLDDTDRYRSTPKPKRMLIDEKNYAEDNELFSGEPVDNNREPNNTIRNEKPQDIHGTLAKAKELAQGRDAIENMINDPNQRPLTRYRE